MKRPTAVNHTYVMVLFLKNHALVDEFTGLYVWVVPVTSGNLYCTNYLSNGNRYRLYMS